MYEKTTSFKDELYPILGCTRCNLHISRKNIVMYRGNPRSNIMLIAECPGEKEDKLGIPVVGPTGSYLVRLLELEGLTLNDYFVTNSVLCKTLNNADPTVNQLNACSDWVNKIIDLVNPSYIITVGRISSGRMIPQFSSGELKITKAGIEGTCFSPPNLKGTIVIPIRHPSFIKKDINSREKGYRESLRKLVTMLKSEELF